MKYKNIREAKFIERLNRFIATVEINGSIEICHVKNTGRCKELFIPGTAVFVQEADSAAERKTKYDLIGVIKAGRYINVDSQVPNKVFHEWLKTDRLFKDITLIKPEAKYKNSRFDFYIETAEEKIFIEVKGVTLECENIAMFPDAPTERGVKHINELAECLAEGYKAYIVFIIQMKGISLFIPNSITHPEFAEALKVAQSSGVKVLAYDCLVDGDSIEVSEKVEVEI